MKEKIKKLAKDYYQDVIEIRRHIHAHPELSYQEIQTGKYIASKLSEYGISYETGWADNGIVAVVKGVKNEGQKVIALRADMDALPILEANEVDYKSKNKGVMHACGHDVHSASVLGTARILNELRSEFGGSVKFIFQPGEEKLPGGASILIEEGVLEKAPAPQNIIGQHVHPPLEVGKVGFKSGMYMASADELYVSIHGKGGHGALPHNCIDPVLISAHLITSLQQLISRRANPVTPAVLTFGKINSMGGATNIIPNTVKLEGTFRTMDEQWRTEAHQSMKKMAEELVASMGGTCEFEIVKGYPFLQNDDALTERARTFAIEYLGPENVVELPIRMTSEDFAYYSQEIPACFYRLGTGNPSKGITSPVHTNTFNVDEACLELSTGLMAWMTIQELQA